MDGITRMDAVDVVLQNQRDAEPRGSLELLRLKENEGMCKVSSNCHIWSCLATDYQVD